MQMVSFENDGLLNKFDLFCKKVLKFQNYNLLRVEQKERTSGIIYVGSYNDLSEKNYSEDAYKILYFWLKIDGFTVALENEVLYQSLLLLPRKKLKIILLSFFEGMTDKEIGELLVLPKSTVQYNRITALKNIRKWMEAIENEKKTYIKNIQQR